MNAVPIRKMVLTATVWALGWCASAQEAGEDREFVLENCAITLPEGWTRASGAPSSRATGIVLRKPDETAILALAYIKDGAPNEPLTENAMARIDAGMESRGGGKRTAGRIVEVAGIKAYEREGTVMAGGREASTYALIVPADNDFYSVTLVRLDGNAADDPDLRAAVASLRFLTPPAAPVAGVSNIRFDAFRAGKFLGPILLSVVMFIVVIGVAVLTAIILGRSGKKRVLMMPPPLPPEVRRARRWDRF